MNRNPKHFPEFLRPRFPAVVDRAHLAYLRWREKPFWIAAMLVAACVLFGAISFSDHMSPRSSGNDVVNGRPTDTESPSNDLDRLPLFHHFSYSAHSPLGKPGVAVVFPAYALQSSPLGVPLVLRSSRPLQVDSPVVPFVTVPVVYLRLVLGVGYERFGDESVYQFHRLADSHHPVPGWESSSPQDSSVAVAYVSERTDFEFRFRDGLPLFSHGQVYVSSMDTLLMVPITLIF